MEEYKSVADKQSNKVQKKNIASKPLCSFHHPQKCKHSTLSIYTASSSVGQTSKFQYVGATPSSLANTPITQPPSWASPNEPQTRSNLHPTIPYSLGNEGRDDQYSPHPPYTYNTNSLK